MYARLKDEYMLRGWKGLPYAVVEKKSGAAVFVDAKTFSIFTTLDGYSDFDVSSFSPEHKRAWAQLQERGAVDISDAPFPPGLPAPLSKYTAFPCYAVAGAMWSITGGCNLRCRHCYISAPHYKYRDMSTEECLQIADQLAAAGITAVDISGGEPLTRPDFWVIIDRLIHNGINIKALFTNGLLADEKFLDEYEKRGLSAAFYVSFDGIGCHDWLRGIPGCEEKTLAAIKRLLSRSRRVAVSTSLHTGNVDSLFPTYELLVKMGVSLWRPGTIDPSGEWAGAETRASGQKSLSPETLWPLYYELAKRYIADGKPMSIQLGPCFWSEAGPDGKSSVPGIRKITEDQIDAYACSTCRTHPSVMPDGRLLPCTGMTDMKLEAEMPNLLETPLCEVYKDMKKPFFALANLSIRDILTSNEKCRECTWRLECCGGCRLGAIMSGHGQKGYDENNCKFFKDGWRDKFLTLVS